MIQFVVKTLFVAAILAFPLAHADESEASGNIGDFSIEKVRDFSKDSRSTDPLIDSSGAKASTSVKETGYGIVLLRIIGSLVLIVALIYLVIFLLRKAGLTGGSARVGGGSGSMDVLEVLPLGQNRNAVLFRVMDTVYLCSQTQTAISLLDKIEGQRAIELLTSSKGSSTVVHFKEAFNQFISRMKK
ncbi:MAG: flagellar biosynthetic protein FliO [Chitinispirillaceae bacterium]|nr:flagellar biosynthetic protein FliO [Chitinispirillaceae bacterium]